MQGLHKLVRKKSITIIASKAKTSDISGKITGLAVVLDLHYFYVRNIKSTPMCTNRAPSLCNGGKKM